MEWLEYVRQINLASICLRVFLALVIGGLLGVERGKKNRPAGFRTYMLVCLGSVLVMLTNQYIFQQFNVSDPVRMGAQVVSGIGFLGAGTIVTTNKSQIKGITTAAGLWAAACSGLAIGAGFYEGAVIGGFAVFIVMSLMKRMDDYIHKNSRVIDIYLEYSSDGLFSTFLEAVRGNQFEIVDIQISRNKFMENIRLCTVLNVKSLVKRTHAEMIEIISEIPGVEHVEEI